MKAKVIIVVESPVIEPQMADVARHHNQLVMDHGRQCSQRAY
jgi:hypothetical protein